MKNKKVLKIDISEELRYKNLISKTQKIINEKYIGRYFRSKDFIIFIKSLKLKLEKKDDWFSIYPSGSIFAFYKDCGSDKDYIHVHYEDICEMIFEGNICLDKYSTENRILSYLTDFIGEEITKKEYEEFYKIVEKLFEIFS